MGKNDRNGRRRQRIVGTRQTSLERILIVTDAKETEKNYFEGLKKALERKGCLSVTVEVLTGVPARELVRECIQKRDRNPNYADTWIVFDRDRVPGFDRIISEAHSNGINVGWSNPCFEIWLMGYFANPSAMPDSKVCCHRFKEVYERKTNKEYRKNDCDIYKTLTKYGDEKAALRRAAQCLDSHRRDGRQMPSAMNPATTVHELVKKVLDR